MYYASDSIDNSNTDKIYIFIDDPDHISNSLKTEDIIIYYYYMVWEKVVIKTSKNQYTKLAGTHD